MTNTDSTRIHALNELQRQYFASGATRDLRFRKEMLRKLLGAIQKW